MFYYGLLKIKTHHTALKFVEAVGAFKDSETQWDCCDWEGDYPKRTGEIILRVAIGNIRGKLSPW